MARQKSKNKKQDFDFDSYLEEKAEEVTFENNEEIVEEKTEGSFLKNAILIMTVSVLGFFWYFDWSPRNAALFFLEDDAVVLGIEVEEPEVAAEVEASFPEFEFSDTDFNSDNQTYSWETSGSGGWESSSASPSAINS